MSEKIADAIRDTVRQYRRVNHSYAVNYGDLCDLLMRLAENIDVRTPAEPGGEESTPDKPF